MNLSIYIYIYILARNLEIRKNGFKNIEEIRLDAVSSVHRCRV